MTKMTMELYDAMIEKWIMDPGLNGEAEAMAEALNGDDSMPVLHLTDAFKYGMMFGRALTLEGLWDSFAEMAAAKLSKEKGDEKDAQ